MPATTRSMTSKLNPTAKSFASKTLNPLAKEFSFKHTCLNTFNNQHQQLEKLDTLSAAVAESVLDTQSDFHEAQKVIDGFRAKRALEAQVIEIPNITNYDGLEQVAQISYHLQTGQDIYELFWNGKHAILDNRQESWQFPDMPVRDIIHFHFDGNFVLKDDPALDEPASYAPAIQVDVTPIEDEENTWHRWKQFP